MLSPLASAHPDGLEWVAEQKGFLEAARGPLLSLIPDYVFPGVSNEALATILAGVAGHAARLRCGARRCLPPAEPQGRWLRLAESRRCAHVAGAAPVDVMHVHFLDPYRPLASPIHALDGRVKFVLAVAFILTVSLTPYGAWPVYLLLLSLMISIEILSGLGVGYVMRRASLALPFVLAAVPLVFTTPGQELGRLALGPWMLAATADGLLRFANVAVKSWLSVQAAIVLASSTPFPDLLLAMRAVRIPRLLVAMFGLMWRYLFVMADEALRLMRARAARSGHVRRPDGRAEAVATGRIAGVEGARRRRDGRQPVPARHRAQRSHLRCHAVARLRRRGPLLRAAALVLGRSKRTLWIGLLVLGLLWLTGLLAWG